MKERELPEWFRYIRYPEFRVSYNDRVYVILNVYFDINVCDLLDPETITTECEVEFEEIKPYMRSMDDIYEPLPNGEIPMYKLSEIGKDSYIWSQIYGEEYIFFIEWDYEKKLMDFYYSLDNEYMESAALSIDMIEYLESNLFNIYGIECLNYNEYEKSINR